jgi:D-beta-D-heptose 7-phosphate kinase/D-beta-D-heptose 1-phosphate adenosyltransferase
MTIAFTNGCFDIIHYGHVQYLEKAKKKGRILVVGLNSDVSIRRIKGPSRPINPQALRAGVLAALGCVDYVILFEEDTPYQLIKDVQPDILIKGADWKDREIIGSDIVKAKGGKIELISYIEGLSTTQTIHQLQRNVHYHPTKNSQSS